MSNQSLNARIPAYKNAFASGELQQTYQALVGIVQNLRTEFAKKYDNEFAVANILHGYIDFTYFYLQNDFLKTKKLKLALVLNHKNANFELWLLGQTKDIQSHYWKKLRGTKWVNIEVMPEYSVFEVALLSAPDFDDAATLSASVHRHFQILWREISETLASLD